MHVINYSTDSEGSGAGFWVQMVSRVSLQGLYGRVSLQGLHGGSKYFGGPNITIGQFFQVIRLALSFSLSDFSRAIHWL